MAKTGNWTEDEVVTLGEYVPGDMESVEVLMEKLDRTKRSVIGKLNSLGTYVAPEKPAAKKKDEGPTKGEILQSLVDVDFEVDGLESATKAAITRVRDFVVAHKPSVED